MLNHPQKACRRPDLGIKKDNSTFDRFHFTVSFILPSYSGDQIFWQMHLCSICSSLTVWSPVKTVFYLSCESYSSLNFQRWWQINGIDLNVLTFTHCEQRYASVLDLSQQPRAFTDMANCDLRWHLFLPRLGFGSVGTNSCALRIVVFVNFLGLWIFFFNQAFFFCKFT